VQTFILIDNVLNDALLKDREQI